MPLSEHDKAALLKVRASWDGVRAQAQNVDLLLAVPVGELDSDDVWLSNEALRVRRQLHTAHNGVRDRVREAEEMLGFIDDQLRRP